MNEFIKYKIYLEELKDDIDSIYTCLNMSDSQSYLDNSPSLYYLISNNNCIDNYSYFFPVCTIKKKLIFINKILIKYFLLSNQIAVSAY